MTIQLHPITDHAAYQQRLYDFLVKVEAKIKIQATARDGGR